MMQAGSPSGCAAARRPHRPCLGCARPANPPHVVSIAGRTPWAAGGVRRRTGRAARSGIPRRSELVPDRVRRPPPAWCETPPAARAYCTRHSLAEQAIQRLRRGRARRPAHRRNRPDPGTAHQAVRILARSAATAPAALRSGVSMRQSELGCPPRRPGARGIAVEAQHRRRRQPPQRLQLFLGQRRAERRHRPAEARLHQRDHVHIAFDDHQLAARPHRLPREIEPVQVAPLGKQQSLRAVDVFRRRIAQRPAAES